MSAMPLRRSRRGALRRGAATVELALSMIAFIPIFLYALFLDDLLRFGLDAQEAALSTVWDLTVQDWAEGSDNVGSVQHNARLMYCDHESGTDSYDQATDCDGEAHHEKVALTSHPCWLNTGAKQVECTGPDKNVGAMNVLIESGYESEFNKGGMVRCEARIGVQNYMLPQSFLPEFSDVELAKEKMDKGSSVHGNAQSGDSRGANGRMQKTYLMPTETMSLITDTWAINEDVTIKPGEKDDGNHFYKEVSNVYKNLTNIGYPRVIANAPQFFSKAMQDQLLSPAIAAPLMIPMSGMDAPMGGDNPQSPNVSIAPHTGGTPTQKLTQAGKSEYFFKQECRDWDKDVPRQSYQSRQNNYMGCDQAESC
jgi:hypothetical protein